MKNSTLKKIVALILTAIFALTLFIPSFAEEKGSITINSAKNGETYKIYKIFDIASYDSTNEAYVYKLLEGSTNKWNTFITGSCTAYFEVTEINDVKYVKAKDAFDETAAATFAASAISYAATNSLDATATKTATSTTVVFSDLDLGYYLVESSVGALCALTTAAKDATINEKNTNVPTITKKVGDIVSDALVENSSAYAGKVVNYEITINAKAGAKNYVLTDKLDSSLTLGDTITVKKGTSPVGTTNYTLDKTATSDYTFKITFKDAFCSALTDTDTITVSYTATVASNATVNTAIANSATLAYGNNQKTTSEVANVYIWQTEFFKYTKTDTPLAGAVFTLSTSSNGSNPIKLTLVSDTTYRVDASGTVTEITTGDSGKFYIQGLDAGTYYLTEKTAPSGYNKLTTAVEFTTSYASNTYSLTVDSSSATNVSVQNNAGSLLPTTGGSGTVAIIVVGCVLFGATAIILVTKKRMYNEG